MLTNNNGIFSEATYGYVGGPVKSVRQVREQKEKKRKYDRERYLRKKMGTLP